MAKIELSETQATVLENTSDELLMELESSGLETGEVKRLKEEVNSGERTEVEVTDETLDLLSRKIQERIELLDAHTGPSYDQEDTHERRSKIASLQSILTKDAFRSLN